MIRDLDILTGPVLIFGGPYSNLQATQTLLAKAAQLSIPPDNIICTGDIIAYAGDPAATLEAVMQSRMQVVMGNCEESFGQEGDDCGCGFEEGSACDVLSRQWYAHANATLTPDHRQWMRALPDHIRFGLGDYRFAVIHGGVRDISRWIFKSTPEDVKRREIADLQRLGEIDGVIAGHCGVPFFDDLGDKLWLNPGVIGMPANDATPRTWYAILDVGSQGLTVDIQALEYDHYAAAHRMRAQNLASSYGQTLASGLWPNMDVLPDEERQCAGLPIKPQSFHWVSQHAVAAE